MPHTRLLELMDFETAQSYLYRKDQLLLKAKRRCCVDLRALKQPFYKLFYSFIYPVKKNEGVKCYLSILRTSFPYSIWNKMHAYTVSCRERLRHFKRCIILIPYWIFYSRALKHNTLTKFVFKPLF